jgi:hypothetical protein
MNPDRGRAFIPSAFIGLRQQHGIRANMDGTACRRDKVLVERPGKSVQEYQTTRIQRWYGQWAPRHRRKCRRQRFRWRQLARRYSTGGASPRRRIRVQAFPRHRFGGNDIVHPDVEATRRRWAEDDLKTAAREPGAWRSTRCRRPPVKSPAVFRAPF